MTLANLGAHLRVTHVTPTGTFWITFFAFSGSPGFTHTAVWEDISSPSWPTILGSDNTPTDLASQSFLGGGGDNKIEDADHRSVVWFPWQPQNTVGEGRVGTREGVTGL